MLKSALFIFIFSLTSMAQAKNVKFALPEDAQTVQLYGHYGNVEIRSSIDAEKSFVAISSKSDNWEIQPELKQGQWILRIESMSPMMLSQAKSVKNKPEMKVIVYSHKPLNVYWHSGKITINKFDPQLKIRQMEGELRLFGGGGQKDLYLHSGKAYFDKSQADVTFESYNADLRATNMQSSLNLKSFAGAMRLSNNTGKTKLSTHSGRVSLADVEGSFSFDLTKAQMDVRRFKGRIAGQAGDSKVTVGYVGSADINIQADAGRVLVKNPKTSGARVSVASERGGLYLTKGVSLIRNSFLKKGVGKLRGRQAGRVVVRSKSGRILLR